MTGWRGREDFYENSVPPRHSVDLIALFILGLVRRSFFILQFVNEGGKLLSLQIK
jgi:hypothetical protein